MDRLLARVRSFNRTVAEQIGAVGDRFLGRGRAIGASRILWEIGTAGVEVRSLRARLGLDSGYTTRVLQSLARERLVRVEIDRGDRRVRRAVLTARGLAERAELDRRSDDLADRILAPLDEVQRGDLVDAMARVENLLRQSMVRFTVESPHTRDARSCLKRYFAELDARFEKGFDPRVSISADAQELTPPAGLLIVVRMGGRPVGCGAIKFHGKAPAELKRMWIDPAARGSGLGLRLLRELERQAREAGVRALRLETNRALKEAIALYRRAGYTEVRPFNQEPYAHHWFEKRLPVGRTPRAAAKRSR